MHEHRVFSVETTLYHPGVVSVPGEQRGQLGVGDSGQHGGIGDLVAVEVQDRKHRTVTHGVEEFVGVPARRQGAGLGLPVADHTGHDELGVVERRSIGMGEAVAELTAFVDRSRGLGGDVARDPAWKGELPEQTTHAGLVPRDMGVQLAVGPLQPGVGHHGRPPVTGTADVEHVCAPSVDHPVQVGIDEVQPGARAPVAEEPRLDVLGAQRFTKQSVVEQVDLPDGQIVGRPPVGVEVGELVSGAASFRLGLLRGRRAGRIVHVRFLLGMVGTCECSW